MKIENIGNLEALITTVLPHGSSLNGVDSLSLSAEILESQRIHLVFRLLPNLRNVNLNCILTSNLHISSEILSDLLQNYPKVNQISWTGSQESTDTYPGFVLVTMILLNYSWMVLVSTRLLLQENLVRAYTKTTKQSRISTHVVMQETGTSGHQNAFYRCSFGNDAEA